MKARILFVDDEQSVLESIRLSLGAERAEWMMDFERGADQALALLQRKDYDAVVSDICMPGKNGFHLLQRIRSEERTQDIPVIMLTGISERDIKRRALDSGATDLLGKPVEKEDLIARLRNAIRLKDYQDKLKKQNLVLEKRVAERTAELENSRLDIIWRLAKASEHRDQDTGNHVVRVGCYCRAIAEALGEDRKFVEMLFLASPLHDIGKLGIPDAVLLKRGPLTSEEREVMKSHCALGAKILNEEAKIAMTFLTWRGDPPPGEALPQNPILRMASSIALTHHERWDGSGYPEGLEGEEIPMSSRIVALSDVYDALCSERPYKRALPEKNTLEIIRSEVGRQFDPKVHAAFLRSLAELRTIRTVLVDHEEREAATMVSGASKGT